ncbi:MAG TPA: MlaD family protein [Solirubrobacterales bacterium]
MNRNVSRITASPVMIGALTVIISILAVFLAYNANSGLPFTPTYKISSQVENANTLVPGNEVRIGGVRVGQIEAIEPVADDQGAANAKLDLRLDPQIEPLPVDSTVIVRSRSALGIKYLEIVPGDSEEGYEAGSLMPLTAATPEPVEIDQFFGMFDPKTRTAIQTNLREFGNTFAGRGGDLNSAIGELQPLVERLLPVATLIASPKTQFDELFPALAQAAAEVAPVAQTQADMFVSLDETFGALASVARPFIQETITRSVPAEQALIDTGPRIRTFLGHSATLFHDLRPGAQALADNAPALEAAAVAGAEVLPGAPALNRRIPPVAAALRRLNDDQAARTGLNRLTQTMNKLDPTLRFATPAQTVCNYGFLLFRNLESTFSGSDGIGTWQRFLTFNPPTGGDEPNNEGIPSAVTANGPGATNYLHVNPYPNTASPGQSPTECEAGNEPWLTGQQVIGNVPGDQGTSTEGQG